MQRHYLKILPMYFIPVIDGTKTFEIRKNDRNYQVGDLVFLEEYCAEINAYTHRKILVEITYITDYNQKDDYVVFSFRKV